MNANPWGTYADVPRIFDFVDDTLLTLARYENHLLADPGAGPDDSAPAFLLSATPNLDNAVNVGLTEFRLCFSEPMDTSIDPVVSFDTLSPFTEHVVDSIGWSSTTSPSRTWRGTFAVGIETGDGINSIRVAGARAADGFQIPGDTSHQFVIDTRAGLSGHQASANPISSEELQLVWEPSTDSGAMSYSIRRSNAARGPYNLVGTVSASLTEYTDKGLQPETTYFYQIVEVDAALNSRQLTNPFSGTTDPLGVPTRTPTPSPTVTETPVATPTYTPDAIVTPTSTSGYDVGPNGIPDGTVDARDLLQIIGELSSKENGPDTLFDFAQYWMDTAKRSQH
jgi:hypothetical protein